MKLHNTLEQLSLFVADAERLQMRNQSLQQFFTPQWAAQLLVDRYFPDLTPSDFVLEPSAGRGAFLQALPDYVRALGVEIDPELAIQAAANTGRQVICGDFCRVELPEGITQIVGNPPFEVRLLHKFLSRARNILPEMGRAGFLLPAYAFQTHTNVMRWLDSWSMRADMIPRRLFPNAIQPLVFVVFTRNRRRQMIGFALYPEMLAMDHVAPKVKEVMVNGRPRKNVWLALVDEVMTALGEEARLQDIYRAVEPRRPTPTTFWKEKVRQVLQINYRPLGDGRWARA